MAPTTYSVPGVYRQPQPRVAAFPRARTDVVGFVGFAGTRRLHEAVRLDDWRSYLEEFERDDAGDPLDRPPGTLLAKTVRDFFSNGGARCWVVNAGEGPEAADSQRLLNTMMGLADADGPQGLELLLRQEEVSIVILPELDALIEEKIPRADDETGRGPPCFLDCAGIETPIPPLQMPPAVRAARRVYTHAEVLWAQRYLLSRLQREKWRWFGILSPPENLDQAQVVDWRDALTAHTDECHCAALYWPWVLTQEKPGAPVERRSPAGFVAGVFARRDLAHGPHSAPANERLKAVVGLERPIDDEINGFVYERGVNVLRSLPGRGINLWGARTLHWKSSASRSEPLAYVSVRRCLSAIERMAERIGQQVVFAPHSPLLRVQVSQAITSYLQRVFESGALLGAVPEEAFFVRCDASNNPSESVQEGRLVCEVGVALSAPAEFIVFRVGRREGVVAVEEVG